MLTSFRRGGVKNGTTMDTLTYLANYVNAQDFRRSQQIQHALQLLRGVVPRCAGGAMAPPDFSRSVNPISTSHSVRFGGFLSKNYFSFKKQLIYHQNHY